MKLLRRLIAVLLFGPVVVGYSQITSADNSVHLDGRPSVKLTISTASTQFKVGEPVRLEILLTNISGKEIFVGRSVSANDIDDYELFVIDDHGKSAPTTASYRFSKGKRQPGDPIFYSTHSRAILLVSPSKSVKNWIDIGKAYKIDRPGAYKIWVERLDQTCNQRVRSNIITVTVMP
jgi:hypothetical protein